MTLDWEIRQALRGVHGPEREAAKLAILSRPKRRVTLQGRQMRAAKGAEARKKKINFRVRLTARQYLLLCGEAKTAGISPSEHVRRRVFGLEES